MTEHHLILGDFGRVGTLRYFREFSRAERELITAGLSGAPFFDEYRRVTYSVVGLLPDIKGPFIERYREAGRPLDNGILVGAGGGLRPEDVLPRIVGSLAPWLSAALSSRARRVKIIIPCNTLAPLAEPLERVLSDAGGMEDLLGRHGIAVTAGTRAALQAVAAAASARSLSVPSIPRVVIGECVHSLKPRVAVLGTDVALECYRQAARERRLDVEIFGYQQLCDDSFESVINSSIQGGAEVAELSRGLTEGYTVISACTDVEVEGAIDSTTVFARHIAAGAYSAGPRD
jgi:hypothetical protein